MPPAYGKTASSRLLKVCFKVSAQNGQLFHARGDSPQGNQPTGAGKVPIEHGHISPRGIVHDIADGRIESVRSFFCGKRDGSPIFSVPLQSFIVIVSIRTKFRPAGLPSKMADSVSPAIINRISISSPAGAERGDASVGRMTPFRIFMGYIPAGKRRSFTGNGNVLRRFSP